jgi:hypothetical protein
VPEEHQQAVEEEFGPENFVVVVRGLLDEAWRWICSLERCWKMVIHGKSTISQINGKYLWLMVNSY